MNPEIVEQAVEQAEVDYIVVGSGAGGGPLAGNLAKAGYRVMLFEAGGEDENYHYQVPCFHGLATEDECYAWDYFVRHYSDDDKQKADSKYVPEKDGVFYPRAGTLGGCTAHNAMITVYPHNEDWDDIAKLTGESSWSSSNMRQYFERLENCGYVNPNKQYHGPLSGGFLRVLSWLGVVTSNPSKHGFSGWLSTELADVKLVIRDLKLIEIILEATKKAFIGDGTPLTNVKTHFDPNDWRAVKKNTDGLVFTPLATRKGRRNGPREYIRSVKEKFPENLIVKTGALVTRVLFDENNKAIGVEYLEGRHLYKADPRSDKTNNSPEPSRQKAFVKREVILATGAFNTPQLLKLSGIGPKAELESLGIPVIADLPGVGENLQDRYEVGVVTKMAKDFALLKEASFLAPAEGETGDPCFVEWLNDGKGVYTTNGVVVGIIKRSKPNKALPDLYIFGVPGFFKGYYPGYSKELQHHKDIFTWAILKAHTNNTAGQVKLRTSDPRDTPLINFHYFDESNDSTGDDLEAVVDGVEFVRSMNVHIDFTHEELLPGPTIDTREKLKQFIKDEAWGHHASCSCKIGKADDPMAVLDKDFKVYKTQNLRVVDASVFPRIPGFFIVTAIYMISEKASDVIIADAE
jgi:choline dehydrogenase